MKIGIIGLGFVGLSFASVLSSKGFDIVGIDIDKEKLNIIKSGKSPFYEPKIEETLQKALQKKLMLSDKIEYAVNNCDLIFVTVGTPMSLDGNIDLQIILNACKKIGEVLLKTQNKPNIIIKSTVIPGTTINKIKRKLLAQPLDRRRPAVDEAARGFVGFDHAPQQAFAVLEQLVFLEPLGGRVRRFQCEVG